MRQRDQRRTNDPADPSITILDDQILKENNRNIRKEWQKEMETCPVRRHPVKLWRAIHHLSGKITFIAPNQLITFTKRCLNRKNKIDTSFVNQFTWPTPYHRNSATRRIIRQIVKKHKLNHNSNQFTTDQVRKALEDSKNSTALSPDKLIIHQFETPGTPWPKIPHQNLHFIYRCAVQKWLFFEISNLFLIL